MGFGPSPDIAQAAHEAVLYGADGIGSEQARRHAPVVCSAARWSGQRVPDVGSPEASAPHALVIDDLLLFRQVPLRSEDTEVRRRYGYGDGDAGYEDEYARVFRFTEPA